MTGNSPELCVLIKQVDADNRETHPSSVLLTKQVDADDR